jgi:hypothetical protein
MTIDIYVPIIPYAGMGGIKLYSSIDDLENLLSHEHVVKKNGLVDPLSYRRCDVFSFS